ncbi:DUF3747 domain-containing protein [Chroococcus sp. FPU101]|uniref:DUF3747 domain-containing protein n=1 Tax=Chroococcus sp. FPU101 TaxID=1974212 RepID=UPI001A8E0039|nr:DUF3747 domain-containing protein [Chroococcus sp. FPU101]GFE69541.1 hypothetical protein CFPU101_21510 [Chroococcus sp. FPU101]
MKFRNSLHIAALASLTVSSIIPCIPAQAQGTTFEEQEVEQQQVIAVARPFGDNKYDLLVIEQIPEKQQCWSEIGAAPAIVEPLLLNFDFTGICRRATDSNGYSIRLDGQDLGLNYILRLVERNGELLLVGSPRTPNMPEIVVGRTRGVQRDFMKVVLDPGWKFSKRAFNGKQVGHFYFSGNSTEIAAASGQIPPVPPTDAGSVASFKDISNDIYKSEIEKAVALGFVAGFKEDNTFRPETPVTREQLVSMVIDAMNTVVKIDVNAAATSSSPFTDVADDRWSANKIKWAQQNQIVAGKADGQFKPTDPITRAELMVILRKVSEYLNTQTTQSSVLVANTTPMAFSDISGHWAETTIIQMSSFCNTASPFNEQGDAFAPNQPANRNYAAAAIIRSLDCVKASIPSSPSTNTPINTPPSTPSQTTP